ncbi:MAG: DUF3306 domain-containing protein [Limnohabitans sp.]
MSEGFFNRWSRRKREAGQGDGPAPGSPQRLRHEAPPLTASGALPATVARSDLADGTAQARPQEPAQDAVPAAPLPTLEDVRQLTPQSDFQPFMQRGVGAEVRNAAMKKLFADPHFNVMDGLDIYIDDYNLPDPMPAGMLRKMVSAQFMKLVPEEEAGRHPQDPDGGAVPAQGGEVVAQSPDSSATAEPAPHDHPDLQLQPDPAAASGPSGPGPR